MNHADDLRDDAREWDISECPVRAARARAAADRIDELEVELARFYDPPDDAVEMFSPEIERFYRGELTVWFRDERKETP